MNPPFVPLYLAPKSASLFAGANDSETGNSCDCKRTRTPEFLILSPEGTPPISPKEFLIFKGTYAKLMFCPRGLVCWSSRSQNKDGDLRRPCAAVDRSRSLPMSFSMQRELLRLQRIEWGVVKNMALRPQAGRREVKGP